MVGGGPAGSSVAFGLRGSGLRVVVLDRAHFPRDKTCAGWITPPVLQALGVDPQHYARGRVLQPICGFRVRREGGREARADLGRVVSYGIRRCEFDAFLLERCGATLRLGWPLRSLERDGGGWLLNGSLRAGLVVGAGGHFCRVARQLAPERDRPGGVVVAQEVEVPLAPQQAARCRVEPALPEIRFCSDLRGYGWVFRKGDWLNVGLGRQDPAGLGARLRAFLAWLRDRGRLPGDLPLAPRGHAYLLYERSARPLVAPGAALVGDAAGLAYSRSGEGIRPAVESGLLLARVLREELRAGRAPQHADLGRYARALVARLGPRRWRPGVTDRLPAGLVRPLAGGLLGSRPFARRVVVSRWFVHEQLPALPAD